MNSVKINIIRLLPILSAVLLLDGCMPRKSDGSYEQTYSYHPYYKKERQYITNHDGSRYTKLYQNRDTSYKSESSFIEPSVYQNENNARSLVMNYGQPPQQSQPRYDTGSMEFIELVARSQIGKPYQWAANGPYAFDCSGFTKYVYAKQGITLPRVSREQAQVGQYVPRANLRKGDLIFFSKQGVVNHTGIYLGQNRFIHASSVGKGVVISSLNEPYYDSHFTLGRRVIY